MENKIKTHIEDNSIEWEQMSEKVKRKIMCYDDKIMLVKVHFQKGGIGPVHKHHHSQTTYIESGVFEVEIGGTKKILKGGDSFYIPGDVMHGAVTLEEGILIDVFSPMREDFLV